MQDRDLDRGLNAARIKVNGFLQNITTGISQGLGIAIAQGLGNLINAGIDQIGKATKAASDLNEAVNKTNVAFGDSAQEILDWSSTSATAFGQSRGQALEAASTFGLLFRTMGLTTEASVDMSTGLVELASDMASINNISIDEALVKIRAGLVGEIEPLRTVGVLLSAAAVETKALELGLAASTKEISEQDKVMARYQLILDQTVLTQGDFARTTDDLANAQRILDAQLVDTSVTLGNVLLPIRTAFVRGLSELITIVKPYGENILRSFAGGLADGIVYILPILAQLRAVFVELLRPGSPPKLLPELTAWGQAAMQEYLRGWTLADFDALRALGGVIEGVVRSFAGSGNIAETDLVSRIFGTQRTITQAVREFRQLGQVSEATLGSIADAAGPAGTEVAGLVREYFNLQRATKQVQAAQDELNGVTKRYDDTLGPVNDKLRAIRKRQEDLRDQQRLEELGNVLKDPRALASERELARLEIEEIRLADHAQAIEEERDTAVDAAQAKIDAAQAEADAQKAKFSIAQQALEQQQQTNALIEEETDLRKRLIEEGLQEERRVLALLEEEKRKADAAERERLSDLERIYDARLRFMLASTDTAGQIALLEAELAKVPEGSAEAFDLLTQLVGLRERLVKETPAGSDAVIVDAITGIAEASEKWPEVVRMEEALEQFFATLRGQENVVTELTWGQSIVDAIQEIGRFAEEVTPHVQNFIDVIMGKDVEGLGGAADPFAGNFWLAGLIPFIDNLILTLDQVLTGDWAGLWQRFKDYVDEVLNLGADDPDGTTIFFYTWLKDTVIPLFESLAAVEWADIWRSFEDTVIGTWDTIVGYIDARIAEIVSAFNELKDFWNSLPNLMPNLGGGSAVPGTVLPGSGGPFNDPFGGLFPNIAPPASLIPNSSSSSMINSNNTVIQIEQVIGANSDLGGVRQAAEQGIREALINRRLNG